MQGGTEYCIRRVTTLIISYYDPTALGINRVRVIATLMYGLNAAT